MNLKPGSIIPFVDGGVVTLVIKRFTRHGELRPVWLTVERGYVVITPVLTSPLVVFPDQWKAIPAQPIDLEVIFTQAEDLQLLETEDLEILIWS
jgi:hypothetical protein